MTIAKVMVLNCPLKKKKKKSPQQFYEGVEGWVREKAVNLIK